MINPEFLGRGIQAVRAFYPPPIADIIHAYLGGYTPTTPEGEQLKEDRLAAILAMVDMTHPAPDRQDEDSRIDTALALIHDIRRTDLVWSVRAADWLRRLENALTGHATEKDHDS